MKYRLIIEVNSIEDITRIEGFFKPMAENWVKDNFQDKNVKIKVEEVKYYE